MFSSLKTDKISRSFRGEIVLLRLLILMLSLPAYATVFQPQPVEQQIKESDGIMIGHYLKSRFVKLDDGSVATQMIFKMNSNNCWRIM